MKWKRSKKAQQEAKISSRDDVVPEKRGPVNMRTCGRGDGGGLVDMQNNTTGIVPPEESHVKTTVDCPTPSAASATVQTQSHHISATQLNRSNYHIMNSTRTHEQDGNCESLYRPYVS